MGERLSALWTSADMDPAATLLLVVSVGVVSGGPIGKFGQNEVVFSLRSARRFLVSLSFVTPTTRRHTESISSTLTFARLGVDSPTIAVLI